MGTRQLNQLPQRCCCGGDGCINSAGAQRASSLRPSQKLKPKTSLICLYFKSNSRILKSRNLPPAKSTKGREKKADGCRVTTMFPCASFAPLKYVKEYHVFVVDEKKVWPLEKFSFGAARWVQPTSTTAFTCIKLKPLQLESPHRYSMNSLISIYSRDATRPFPLSFHQQKRVQLRSSCQA